MIELFVFYLHVVGIAAGFTKRWNEDGVGEGVLAVLSIALIFFVGWAMASFLVRLALPPEGLGKVLNRDAAALLLLTVSEAVFYYFYFRGENSSADAVSGAGS